MVAEMNVNVLAEVKSAADISLVAMELKSPRTLYSIERSLISEGIMFYQDDLYPQDILEDLLYDRALLSQVLSTNARDSKSSRVLHVLQLIGAMNPYLEEPVGNLIKQFTV